MRVQLQVQQSEGDSSGAPSAGMRVLRLPRGGGASSDDDEPEDMQASEVLHHLPTNQIQSKGGSMCVSSWQALPCGSSHATTLCTLCTLCHLAARFAAACRY